MRSSLQFSKCHNWSYRAGFSITPLQNIVCVFTTLALSKAIRICVKAERKSGPTIQRELHRH